VRPSEPDSTKDSSCDAASASDPRLHDQLEVYSRELRELRQKVQTQQAEAAPALEQLQRLATELRKQLAEGDRATQLLEQSCTATLRWLIGAADRRDGESRGHSERVSRYTHALAKALGRSPLECQQLALAGLLHDAGRVEWPDTILLKRGPLSQEERAAIEAHCDLATNLKGTSSRQLDLIAEVIAHHHEHWDGTGYPHGLAGEAIPLSARIVQLADVYDTLRTACRYKATQSHLAACRAILQGDRRVSPDNFDPAVLDAFGRAAPGFADRESTEP